METKSSLTKLFLTEAGLGTSEAIVKTYLKLWWVSPYSPIGFRLSNDGNKFLSQTLKLQKYSYTIKEDNIKSLKLYLRMNKYIAAPYYLQGNNTIIFYGETDAVMMGMYGGDIAQYLENFTR